MSNKPILFFSNDCVYSKQFLSILSKYNFIQIEPISIDPNPRTKSRPKVFYDVQNYLQYKITKVPTVVLFGNDNYAISGDEAFKWIKYTINKHTSQKQQNTPGIKEYNPNEMGNFSDSYSKYGSTDIHDTSEQAFQFIGKEERIFTPKEEQFSNIDAKQKELERDQYINIQRPSSTPRFSDENSDRRGAPNINLNVDYNNSNIHIPKQNVDFSNSNFGFASNYQGNSSQFQSKTQKSQEFDNRLESLLSQRESHVPSNRPNITPDKIDWTTGQIMQ